MFLLGVSVQLGLGQPEQVVDEVGVTLDVDMLDQSEVSIEWCGCGPITAHLVLGAGGDAAVGVRLAAAAHHTLARLVLLILLQRTEL